MFEFVLLVVIAIALLFFPVLFVLGVAGTVTAWIRDRPKRAPAIAAAIGVVGTVAEAVGVWQLSKVDMTKGRLLRYRGRARTAPSIVRDDWAVPVTLEVSELSKVERAYLGAAWLHAAELEHAAVAAFAQLSLRLMRLGAPPGLVEHACQASTEEVDHAKASYSIASELLGTRLGPGGLVEAIPDKSHGRHSETRTNALARLARASIVDGMMGEGLAARVALEASRVARCAHIRAVLEKIAREESSHAALGRDTLIWCLEQGGREAAASARNALVEIRKSLAPRVPEFQAASAEMLARFGVLQQDDLGRHFDACIEHVNEEVLAIIGPTQQASRAA